MTIKELNRLKCGDVVRSLKERGEKVQHKDKTLNIYGFEFISFNKLEGCVKLRSMSKDKVELIVDFKKFTKNYEVIL